MSFCLSKYEITRRPFSRRSTGEMKKFRKGGLCLVRGCSHVTLWLTNGILGSRRMGNSCGKSNSQTEDITFPQQHEIYETQLKFNCDLQDACLWRILKLYLNFNFYWNGYNFLGEALCSVKPLGYRGLSPLFNMVLKFHWNDGLELKSLFRFPWEQQPLKTSN